MQKSAAAAAAAPAPAATVAALPTTSINVKAALGRFVANSGYPASIVESLAFRTLLDDVASAVKLNASVEHVSRRTATREADKAAGDNFNAVKTYLLDAIAKGSSLAITLDYGSTDGTMKPILGMTATVLRSDFSRIDTVTIGAMYAPGRHTIQVVNAQAEKIINGMEIPYAALASVTHDGASNMNDLFSTVLTCMDIPCEAHRLSNIAKNQLLIKAPHGVRSFGDMYNTFHSIITCIRASSLRRQYFLKLQEDDDSVCNLCACVWVMHSSF